MINKIIFIGSKPLGLAIINKMFEIESDKKYKIISFDDSSDDRNCLQRFKDFSFKRNIDIAILNGPKGLKHEIESFKPDLVFVSGWYWIIPSSILKLAKHGFIGIHGSLLPKYRGFSPLVWSLINGDKKTGISLFYFSKGIDTGDVISQKEIIININTNISDLLEEVEKKSIEIINENYEDIILGKNKRISQNEIDVSYCGIRKPDDGQINWEGTNINIHNFIKAQCYPYPGAFTFLNNEKYYVQKSRIINDKYFGASGSVVKIGKNSIIVCCGENALEISNLVQDGSKTNVVEKISFGEKFKNNL